MIAKLKSFIYCPDKAGLRKAAEELCKAQADQQKSAHNYNVEGIEEVSAQREESGIESNSIDEPSKVLSRTQWPLEHSWKLAFKVAMTIKDWDYANICLNELPEHSFEYAMNEAMRHENIEGLEAFVESVEACEVLAGIHLEREDPQRAASYAHHALELNRNSSQAWIVLAKILEAEGNKPEALKSYFAAADAVQVDFTLIAVYL